jgi:hypothetical protein
MCQAWDPHDHHPLVAAAILAHRNLLLPYQKEENARGMNKRHADLIWCTVSTTNGITSVAFKFENNNVSHLYSKLTFYACMNVWQTNTYSFVTWDLGGWGLSHGNLRVPIIHCRWHAVGCCNKKKKYVYFSDNLAVCSIGRCLIFIYFCTPQPTFLVTENKWLWDQPTVCEITRVSESDFLSPFQQYNSLNLPYIVPVLQYLRLLIENFNISWIPLPVLMKLVMYIIPHEDISPT